MIEDDRDIILPRALKQSGVLRLDLEASDCRRMEDLPLHHSDPFDRMLVAQAMQHRSGIISRDPLVDRHDIFRGW